MTLTSLQTMKCRFHNEYLKHHFPLNKENTKFQINIWNTNSLPNLCTFTFLPNILDANFPYIKDINFLPNISNTKIMLIMWKTALLLNDKYLTHYFPSNDMKYKLHTKHATRLNTCLFTKYKITISRPSPHVGTNRWYLHIQWLQILQIMSKMNYPSSSCVVSFSFWDDSVSSKSWSRSI